jgi:hypothetical protein
LATDASRTGLGAVLAQKDPKDPKKRKIILYASRALTEVEQHYYQVERVALANFWACKRVKLYLIGKEFELNVDNKAIQLIFGNPKAKTCAKIERWSLRLIAYKFKIKHIPAISNIADYISRHMTQKVRKGSDYVAEYINSLVDYNMSLNLRLESLIQATIEDDVINKFKTMLLNDSCDDDSLKPY